MATPQPQTTKNPAGGIFQYLLKIEGTDAEVRKAQAALSKLTPETAAVYQALNALPEGELKNWLMANPVQFWKKIIELIRGRKYTRGDYTLGERLNDQIYCNPDVGQTQVSDQMVDLAHTIFNQLFGVRIATSEDLDALDGGWNVYTQRPVSQGISDEAIDRAVWLKTNFYPISTYNRQCWDLSHFEQTPLVDRIPDHEIGKWYSGPLLGGGTAVNGLIPVSAQAILSQYVGGDFNPETGTVTDASGNVITPGSGLMTDQNFFTRIIDMLKANPLKAGLVIAAAVYAYYELEND